jgi:hypothetical protein
MGRGGPLKLMWDTWNEVFRKTLGLPSAAWCRKSGTGATSGRTSSAFSSDDAYRALDSPSRC